MKLKSIKDKFYEELSGTYGQNEASSFFYILCDSFLELSKVNVVLNYDSNLNEEQVNSFINALSDLKDFKPIQYIVGNEEFYGLKFFVSKGVLIPRPETEELVSWIETDFKDKSPSILDIGSGSGCIPITLDKVILSSKVFSVDVSDKAIEIAKINAKENNSDVQFIKCDILRYEEEFKLDKCFDVIVSNPPYVTMNEMKLMKENVLDYEPHLALFVENNDPLIFYRTILELSESKLNTGGVVYFEINEHFPQEMIRLFEDFNFTDIELRKDFRGKPRMIKGRKN